MKTCPTCKQQYDDGGNSWKKQCYDCYKNFKGMARISGFRHKEDLYWTHPSVTKEELDEWIKSKGLEVGWGAKEFTPLDTTLLKLWRNDTNYE